MPADRISDKIAPEASGGAGDEKQFRALQFIKKLKTSSNKTPFYDELEKMFADEPETTSGLFIQLLHNELPAIRRFALIFFGLKGSTDLVAEIKNMALIEEDIDNLKMALKQITGWVGRAEIADFFDVAAIPGGGQRSEMVAEFLKAECEGLNIDYKRMFDAAELKRKQAREKRIEKYEKKNRLPDDGIVITDVVTAKIKNPKAPVYAGIALASLVIVLAAIYAYSWIMESYTLGRALYKIDDCNEKDALQELKEFSVDSPGNAAGLFHLHRIYCENYDIINANSTFSKILALRDASYVTLLCEARNALFSGELKKARDFFKGLPADAAARGDIEYFRLQLEYMENKTASGVSAEARGAIFGDLERFYRKNERGYKPYVLNFLVTAAADCGRFNESRQYFDEIQKLVPYDFKAAVACAYYRERAADPAGALGYYDRALALEPPENIREYILINSGRAAKKLQKIDQAIDYYTKWRELRPDSCGPLLALMESYGEKKENGGLNSVFSDAVARFGNEPLVFYNFAVIKMKSGEPETAIKNFNKALALKPDMAEANYNIGRCLQILSEKFEAHSVPWNQYLIEATDYYKKSLAQNAGYTPAHISLGIIAMSKNPPDYNSAVDSFNRALKISPASKEALFNLMAVGRLKGDAGMVEKYRAEILKAFPDDEEAKERMKDYENSKNSGK